MAKLHSMFRPHERVYATVVDDGMTRQEFAEESDINTLMQRYDKIGGAFPPPVREPQYLDTSEMPTDFREAMDRVIAAEDAFMSLPATVRRDLGNDPVNFVEFASKEENLPKLREWGLAKPLEAPPEPLSVRVVAEPAPDDAARAKP